jgi:hypothetical protein
MEYTSYLAGEKFSDAPECTDRTLAVIARAVNDYSGDSSRQRLALLAADLTMAGPADTEIQQALARRVLLTALPHATGERRRVLIVALLGLERAAAGRSKGFSDDVIGLDAEFALLGCTSDVMAARRQVEQLPVPPGQHHRRGLARTIELAVASVADEAPNADDLLFDLLLACLDDHRHALADRARTACDAPVPAYASSRGRKK